MPFAELSQQSAASGLPVANEIMSGRSSGASPSPGHGDAFLPPSASNHGDVSQSPTSGLTQAFHFSSGNPRFEGTRGIMHLFDEGSSSPHNLPADRKPLVCLLDIPNHMIYADFCRFCGSFVQHMLEMRIVRCDDLLLVWFGRKNTNDGMKDHYSVLVRFSDQSSADSFFTHFKGKKFSSLEVETCKVLYVLDIQYIGSLEYDSTEQVYCPVCLERLDQEDGAILTTICNHSFHCSCISKWADSSCPVCRYYQQQPDKSTCSVCGTSENLWICLICGFVGCGIYKESHAIRHWKETQHCFSFELETQRVWDYVGDNYVHRLIQSKTDGKLVELSLPSVHSDDTHGSCKCRDSEITETIFNSKFDTIIVEYDVLRASQLENQRKYFESMLQEARVQVERETSEGIEKAFSTRLHKLQAKLDKAIEEKRFNKDINENLLKNIEMWKMKIQQIEAREQASIRLKDEKIHNLEEQLKDLMCSIETQNKPDDPPSSISTGTEGATIPLESSSSTSKGHRRRT